MRSFSITFRSAIVWIALAACIRLNAASAAPEYTITDLGTLGGTSSYAEGINASGQIVGYSYASGSSSEHAFLYSNGVMTDLGTLGGTFSVATKINDSGQVVGFSAAVDQFGYAFLYSGGTMTDLGAGSESTALDINNTGQIAGAVFNRAFVDSNGSLTELGNGVPSYAQGINSVGQVVGAFYVTQADGSETNHAFLYSGGNLTDLGTLGGSYSSANAVNARGEVVGGAATNADMSHAFLYSGGVMHDLGTLGGSFSSGFGINDLGQVIGISETNGDIATVPFLYSNATMTDLNSFLPANSGWTLLDAEAINNAGQIVGDGLNAIGQDDAFLLTPANLPEPASAGLFGLIILGALIRRAR